MHHSPSFVEEAVVVVIEIRRVEIWSGKTLVAFVGDLYEKYILSFENYKRISKSP